MEDEDLELLLCQSLGRNRYLIFMDDMWDIGAWDDLQSSFPNDQNGSTILITSSLSDVVFKVTLESNLFNLRPLSDDETWEFLRMKIFPKQCCSEELWEVGKTMLGTVKGCLFHLLQLQVSLKGET
ncbi:putative late blight resistance protein homolog R1A-3 [Coffea eugenioides]|uniref:putative late blight resistance protein homolog R1A-3 n=1 Tax=Coffea eugenioides TaxID=49369 RepID=UPI000F610A51|nr:putative late blight resistance protein homolog R1A-3 [Coffea eugenioides]